MINNAAISSSLNPAAQQSIGKAVCERVVIGGLMKHLFDLSHTNVVKAERDSMTSQDLYTAAQVMSLPPTAGADSLPKIAQEYKSFFETISTPDCFVPDYQYESTVQDNILDAVLVGLKAPEAFSHIPRQKWSATEYFNLGNAPTLFRTSSHDRGSALGVPSIMRSVAEMLAIVMEVPKEDDNASIAQNGTNNNDKPDGGGGGGGGAACTTKKSE